MLLGIDLGTSSVKALLLQPDGRVVAEAAAAYSVRSPREGWAETDPADWWEAVGGAVHRAAGGRGQAVTAMGLSGQMHGLVLCDGDGAPLRPAILWADRRAVEELAAYRGLPRALGDCLGNPPAVGMAGPSLLWLKRQEPEAYGRARFALQPKDWLRLRLCGVAGGEPSDASATLLYDLERDGWADDVVEALEIRRSLLAPLRESAEPAGELAAAAAEHLGLPAGLPVACGAADTAAAALGSGLLEPGPMLLTVGTGAQIVAPLVRPLRDPSGRTHCYRAAAPHRWYAMAAIQNAGLALEWARGVLGMSWEAVYAEAFGIAGSQGVIFHPYISGERTPYFQPRLRGAWSGLASDQTRAHLMRAALEGVAFAPRQGLEAPSALGLEGDPIVLAGGGSVDRRFARLLAEVLGRALTVAAVPSASARGAALLAGRAGGAWGSLPEALSLTPAPAGTIEPSPERSYEEAYASYVRRAASLAREAGSPTKL